MSEHIKKITEEEEAWQEIERKQIKNSDDIRFHACVAAYKFALELNNTELSIMTIRKAFEHGFIQGWKRNGSV